jgi:hypothetical protein
MNLQNSGAWCREQVEPRLSTINAIARSTCDEAIQLFLAAWIASLTLAMTTSRRARQPPNRHRPASTEHLDPAIQYSEASAMESKSRGVLDTPLSRE